jgi:hypothetical protein
MNRRTALQSIALGVVAHNVAAAEQHHHPENSRPETTSNSQGVPRFFSTHQYKTLCVLCDSIIPPDETSGGAVDAGAPELIDLLASENEDYQTRLSGGLLWLDSACRRRFGNDFRNCSESQRKEILDLIAYREHGANTPELQPGIAFFSFLRDLTLGGYFTSEIGMKYLPYLGNQSVRVFPACPPVPE